MATRTLLGACCYDARDAFGSFMTVDGGSDVSFTSTPTHPVTGNTYVGTHGWKESVVSQNMPFTSGEWITVNLWFRYSDRDAPASDQDTIVIADGASSTILKLVWKSTPNNTFQLVDNGGSNVGSSFTLSKDTWQHMLFKFKAENSSSDVLLYNRDSQKVNTTGVDCDPGAATGEILVTVINPVSGTPQQTVYSTSIVVEEDDGTNITDEDTYTGSDNEYYLPDYTADNTTTSDFGSNPDAGDWSNAMARPVNDSNTVQMDSTTPSLGGVSGDGPSGDSNIDNVIFGALWGWRYKRNAGSNFPPQTIRTFLGAHATETSDGTTIESGAATPTTSFQNFWAVHTTGDGSGDVPTSSELIQTQFGPGISLNPRDILCSGCWMQVVHRNAGPPAPVGGIPGPIMMMGVVPTP